MSVSSHAELAERFLALHRPGAPLLLAQNVGARILNAGDGVHEHPTQGLLDIFTIQNGLGRVEGLTVGLVGDIAHSRVARSNIHGLLKLGAHVIVCGPPTLVPPSISKLGVEISYRLDDILPRCDVITLHPWHRKRFRFPES